MKEKIRWLKLVNFDVDLLKLADAIIIKLEKVRIKIANIIIIIGKQISMYRKR